MASGTTTVILIGGLALAGAYFLGFLCPYGLCPPGKVSAGTRGLGPAVGGEGDVPLNDIVWRTHVPSEVAHRGYSDDGYGDYYESNAAHISIA